MEDVRMLVQEEGRAARNLIAFHVDLAAPSAGGKSANRKPPSSPRLLNEARMTKRSSLVVKTGSRVRSASTGRDKKSELQARYWAFLFGNLQRAVDEIYQTCEADESVSECKEVILVLENFTRDFHNLIEWFRLKYDYENTPPPQRPTSLAWEVRKSSPGKVMTQRTDKTNRADKQSPVKKQLNFFSDLKPPSTEEGLKNTFTLKNELSNKYGLSFGDLEGHLQYGETSTEVSSTNVKHAANLVENKPDTRVEENNKENCPSVIKSIDESCNTMADVAMINQSSQTKDIILHSSKGSLKSTSGSGSATKKPQSTVKSAATTLGKPSTLTLISVSKTVPVVPSRKSVPISPTSTGPPRIIPGRNVAAVTFVPGKKCAVTSQAKVNTNLNRSTNNLNKISNTSQQSGEKGATGGLKNDLALDTNKLVEQKKVGPTIEAIDNRLTEDTVQLTDKVDSSEKGKVDLKKVDNSSKNEANVNKTEEPKHSKTGTNIEKPITNGTLAVEKANIPFLGKMSEGSINQQALDNCTKTSSQEKKTNVISDIKLNQIDGQINPSIQSLNNPNLKNNCQENSKIINENTQIKSPTGNSNSLEQNLEDANIAKAVKPKCDKNIQTDDSHLAESAAAKQARAALLRTKTAPSFTRKSNEMLTSSEATLEMTKASRNSAATGTQPKTSTHVLKKQTSVPETNIEKIHDKQVVEKSSNEKPTYERTKMAFPPLKKLTSTSEAKSDKITNDKHAIEKFSNEKPIVEKRFPTKPSYPPATNQSNATESNSGKVCNDKPAIKVSHEKSVCDKGTNPKPAYAAVSNVYRSNTAIELRPRATHGRGFTAVAKSASSENQNNGKSSDEKQVSVKQPFEKQRNEKASAAKPAAASAPRVYRSGTSIDLRPRVSFNRTVVNGTVKLGSRDNQLSKERGSNPTLRNPNSLGKSKTLFKSEQNLRKKNSIDEDGWETVKGRNRWKLSQSSTNIKVNSRFHLPSPATSLPTLALASEPAKLHKDRQNQEIAKANRVASKIKSQATLKQNVKIDSENVSNLGKKGKKEDEVNNKSNVNDRKKMSNVRVKEVKKTLNGVKQDSNSCKIEKLMDMLSSEDEIMNEEEIRKSRELYEKEKKLTKEIQDLEKSEIEVDTETDDAETDGETNIGSEEDETNSRINALKASYEDVCSQLSWADQMDTLEKLEKLIANDTSTKGIPWAERLSTLEQLEELVARHPGRALELHQKLSSPSRRRQMPETLQRHRERQESAQLKRERLLQDKTNKMRELVNKVEEVQKQQAQLKEDRKKRIAEKLKRAEENRALHLRSIQRKAHDEDEKLREIMFINELEAQNKRHDFIASCQEKEGRLQGIHDERQRKQEEKAAKEAAVEERRRLLAAERQERLEKLQEKRREREERIGREQQEKEKERQELAREKARDREERIQAIQAAKQANTEELQKKIQQKQVDSARRHEENIEHIRQRALESGALRGTADDEAPRLTPYDTHKLCIKCNVLIESEVYLLSHLRGKAHQEAVKDLKDNDPVIVDAPPDKMDAKLAQDRERQKSLRKRCKKLRSRMAQRGAEYLAKLSEGSTKLDSPGKARLSKCICNVDKLHASQGVGQWPDNAVTLLERNLAEIKRILNSQNELDQRVFQDLNGFGMLSNILNLALDIPKNMSPYLPPKCFMTTCTVYSLACMNHPDNSRFVVFSNKIALVLDLLLNRLNTLITDDYRTSNKSSANLPVDPVAAALTRLIGRILSFSRKSVPADAPDMGPRLQDIISYTVSVGVVDKLALYCSSVRDPIDNNPATAHFLHGAIQFLTTLAEANFSLVKGDPTQLVATLRVTELVGGVSMLYGMLLHQGAPPSTPPALPPHTEWVTLATLQLLSAVAHLDLNMFQSVLGAEGISLQLRHIASYLLWYCSHPESGGDEDKKKLLHQVIEVVGYFAVNHCDNQMMLQSGHMPTVLQQLCNLPFGYFSDPSLSCHLLPTLLACCHNNPQNKTILEQELNYQLLEDFRNSKAALSNPLVNLIK